MSPICSRRAAHRHAPFFGSPLAGPIGRRWRRVVADPATRAAGARLRCCVDLRSPPAIVLGLAAASRPPARARCRTAVRGRRLATAPAVGLLRFADPPPRLLSYDAPGEGGA
ncbi:hypothetical protein Scep_021276 [Stephania cephalantha]|uniref:Uncharacterized protein n=1 Tax=Stephania cephalantha TaxID=152367 RepID=A0AAP0F8P4_9MAGN